MIEDSGFCRIFPHHPYKKNKDFPNILKTIDEVLSNEQLCVKKTKITYNDWQCEFKKDIQSEEIVKVNIVIYDLYIES